MPDLVSRMLLDRQQFQAELGKSVQEITGLEVVSGKASTSVVGLGKAHSAAASSMGELEKASSKATRVLGENGAAFSNLSGRLSSLSGLSGMGGLGVATLGAAAAFGVLAEASKSVIGNSEENVRAIKSLEQAYATQGLKFSDYSGQVQSFLDTNKQYIQSEYDAKEAIAQLTRAGFDQPMVMRLMADAVNMSAQSGESLKTTTTALTSALIGGRATALIPYGISMKEINAAQKAASTSQKEVTKETVSVEAATKAHTRALDALQLEEDRLSSKNHLTAADLDKLHQLQELAAAGGKNHAAALRALQLEEDRLSQKQKVTAADLDRLHTLQGNAATTGDKLTATQKALTGAQQAAVPVGDKNSIMLKAVEERTKGLKDKESDLEQQQNALKHNWDEFSNKTGPGVVTILGNIVKAMNDVFTAGGQVNDIISKIRKDESSSDKSAFLHDLAVVADGLNGFNHLSPGWNLPGKAGGGRVSAGMPYMVGEKGPEPFVPDQPGTIIPHGAGGDTHFHFDSYMGSEQTLVTLMSRAVAGWNR